MVANETYKEFFVKTEAGKAILEELMKIYYHRISYVPNDPHQTSFNEGARSVINFIMNKSNSN